ncbi:acyl-CoA N-acyltransferase [Xylariaceae sp. FL1272]|nr:acyl-CoA N-acyltransferase [Xylariaceae sp. FL1272]
MAPDDAPRAVLVQTTLPVLPLSPNGERPHIRTERLLIKPLLQTDLQAYHKLRLQPEFMAETTLGKVDANVGETQATLDFFIDPPGVHFLFGIFLAETGELIGDGGIHTFQSKPIGWPAMGYKLGKEHWGKGYATEAMSAILQAWWTLPRHEVKMEIHPGTIKQKLERREPALPVVYECVVGDVANYNSLSKRVLEKLDCEHFGTWDEPDTQLHRLGEPLGTAHYVLSCPST